MINIYALTEKLLETIQSERRERLYDEGNSRDDVYMLQEDLNRLIRAEAVAREAARQSQLDEEKKKHPTAATTPTIAKGESTTVKGKGKSVVTKKNSTSKMIQAFGT